MYSAITIHHHVDFEYGICDKVKLPYKFLRSKESTKATKPKYLEEYVTSNFTEKLIEKASIVIFSKKKVIFVFTD